MATVLPFAGIRPQALLVEQVAAPPYDVINSDEAREYARDKPHCFLHISKPEIDFPAGTDSHDESVYRKGRENLERMLDEGVLARDPAPGFYIYRQTIVGTNPGEKSRHSQSGIVGLVSADDYESNIIKKHELTRPEKEDDRVRHMQALAAQTGPVFLTYPAQDSLKLMMKKCSQGLPVYDFVSEGVQHQFWTVTDAESIAQISAHFDGVPALFVADGHHRSAAAVRYRALCREQNSNHTGGEAYNHFLAVLFPHDELNILGYHRVVKDLGSFDSESFLSALAANFDIAACDIGQLPKNSGQFALYLAGQWFRLDYRASRGSPADLVSSLDVSILQDKVLTPILGINDPRTDSRIDFIGGSRGLSALEKAVDGGQFAAAFACHPVTIEALMKIAEQNKLMPPKSTWFEPKLKSGLVIHATD